MCRSMTVSKSDFLPCLFLRAAAYPAVILCRRIPCGPANIFALLLRATILLLLSYAVCSRAVQRPSSFHSRCAFFFRLFLSCQAHCRKIPFLSSLPAGFVYAGICAFSFSPASISFNFATLPPPARHALPHSCALCLPHLALRMRMPPETKCPAHARSADKPPAAALTPQRALIKFRDRTLPRRRPRRVRSATSKESYCRGAASDLVEQPLHASPDYLRRCIVHRLAVVRPEHQHNHINRLMRL